MNIYHDSKSIARESRELENDLTEPYGAIFSWISIQIASHNSRWIPENIFSKGKLKIKSSKWLNKRFLVFRHLWRIILGLLRPKLLLDQSYSLFPAAAAATTAADWPSVDGYHIVVAHISRKRHQSSECWVSYTIGHVQNELVAILESMVHIQHS